MNFALTTSVGDIDILGEIGGGGFDDMVHDTIRIKVFGHDVLCLSLDRLIETKRAAGREKDLEAIAELEALRDHKNKSGDT